MSERLMVKIKSSLYLMNMSSINPLGRLPIFVNTKCSATIRVPKNINQVYIKNEVRIFYTDKITSKHALLDWKSTNQNQIPDYIENIAIQATTTIDTLSYLGFLHPLMSDRYRDRAHYIDIYVRNIGTKNGIAYEKPLYNYHGHQSGCGLSIYLNPQLEGFPDRWTVVCHEIFHLYQYSYAQFKNRWYLEGMTNCLERLMREGKGEKYLTPLPSTKDELEKNVYNVPYTHIWHRLAYLAKHTNLAENLPLPISLLERCYTDGTPVFKDCDFNGYIFMRRFLENLNISSLRISKEMNLSPYAWTEKLQRSAEFSPVILKTIQETMIELNMNQSKEEKAFLKLR